MFTTYIERNIEEEEEILDLRLIRTYNLGFEIKWFSDNLGPAFMMIPKRVLIFFFIPLLIGSSCNPNSECWNVIIK